jgi:hypothetical protein
MIVVGHKAAREYQRRELIMIKKTITPRISETIPPHVSDMLRAHMLMNS